MKDVAGKVAFITGGASGLGLAMARSFTGAGMKVAIADIEDAALQAAKESFAESNADVICIKVDVTDREALEQAALETEQAFGRVHVVCNNAGVAISGNIADMSYRDWDWLMGVNLNGVINGMQVFTRRIVEHGEGGHIVNTASMAGLIGMRGMSIYNASKFAVVGMSEAFRQDLAGQNIGVSVLCPGFVNTGIYTSERNRPADLGGSKASAFDLSRDASRSPEDIEALKASLENMLDPALVGDMVLQAIIDNDFYILTHPEFRESVLEKTRLLNETFDRWSAFRDSHAR